MASRVINNCAGGEEEQGGSSGSISMRPSPFITLPGAAPKPDDDEEGGMLKEIDTTIAYGTFPYAGPRTPGGEEEGGKGGSTHTCASCFTSVCAVLIAAYITLVDNAPYGLLIFPPSFEMNMLGIQMVVFSAFISQVVYCFASVFPSALGSNIIENVIFLKTIAMGVAHKLHGSERLDMAMSTILFIFGLSTTLTGMAFYLLGLMKLGKISSFVPRHVLLGCIGGMGMFIATQGIGISTGLPWDFTLPAMARQFQMPALVKSGTTILLTLGLTVIRTLFRKRPVLTPLYFFLVPAMFFLILHWAGISRGEAAQAGWLFSFQPLREAGSSATTRLSPGLNPACQSFPGVLSCLSVRLIDFKLVVDNLFTIAAIVFFSIIHVPVNVPALSSTTGIEADLNSELMSHGLSNMLSGLTGGLQNYMAYSTSALYYKTGGGGRASSLCVAALLLGFLGMGPSAISYFPRPLAGCLLLHLGTVLLWESLVEPWERAVDIFEYGVIVTITFSMVVIGFMEGLGIGVLLACCIFVVQGSMVNPIAAAFPGDGLRSRELRSSEDRKWLDLRMQGMVYVIRLRGNLFFGNAEQLYLHLKEVLLAAQQNSSPHGGGGSRGAAGGLVLQFVILDLEDVVAIDYHARERLARTAKMVTTHGVCIVWSQLNDMMRRALRRAGCFKQQQGDETDDDDGARQQLQQSQQLQQDPYSSSSLLLMGRGGDDASAPAVRKMHFFCVDLNSAFSYCETVVLRARPAAPLKRRRSSTNTQQRKASLLQQQQQPQLLAPPPDEDSTTTTNSSVSFQAPQKMEAGGDEEEEEEEDSFLLSSLQTLTSEADKAVLRRLEAYFSRETVAAGHTLWRRNDIPHMAVLLESGLLGVPRDWDDPSIRASMAQQPPPSVRSNWPAHYPHPLVMPHLPMAYTAAKPLPSSSTAPPHTPRLQQQQSRLVPPSEDDAYSYLEVSRPGQLSGELGLFTKELRKYTLMAVRDSVLWRLDSHALHAMLANDPACYVVLIRLALKYASHRLHSLMLVGQLHSV